MNHIWAKSEYSKIPGDTNLVFNSNWTYYYCENCKWWIIDLYNDWHCIRYFTNNSNVWLEFLDNNCSDIIINDILK